MVRCPAVQLFKLETEVGACVTFGAGFVRSKDGGEHAPSECGLFKRTWGGALPAGVVDDLQRFSRPGCHGVD